MNLKNLLLCSPLLFGSYLSANAQSYVPANIDFELGTTANWTYYRGTVASGPVFSLTSSSPVSGLHTLTSGTGTDAYGGFPVVGHGSYSLKLAHDTIDYNADGASYNIHVPAGSTIYKLIYHYAVVLQDAGHTTSSLPIMEITAVDSVSGTALTSGGTTVNSKTSGLTLATGSTDIYYDSWSTGSINLSGYAGQTVTVKFRVGSCATGGAHFGYGYIDVSGLFEESYMLPSTAITAHLDAPLGYATYKWTDPATFSVSYGTTASVSIPAPTVTTTYAVIMTPAAGHGTPDTFYTKVNVMPPSSALSVSGKNGINIYPNPTSGALRIQWTNQQTGTANVVITDVMGRIVSKSVLNINAASGEKQMNLGELANGTYSVMIKSENINYNNSIVIQK